MTWTADPTKHEAVNEHGYRIAWAEGPGGIYYNAYSPRGKHVDSGYDKAVVKAMCEIHREKLEKDRAIYAARKSSKEVA
jgi:hypothetical protein